MHICFIQREVKLLRLNLLKDAFVGPTHLEAAQARAPNNWETPMLSSVIIYHSSPQYFWFVQQYFVQVYASAMAALPGIGLHFRYSMQSNISAGMHCRAMPFTVMGLFHAKSSSDWKTVFTIYIIASNYIHVIVSQKIRKNESRNIVNGHPL